MEIFKLIVGVVLLGAFLWVLYQNRKRTGLFNALVRIDTLVGIVAGMYLVITSIQAIVS